VRDTQPNPTHYAFAALQHTGHIRQLVTQNVDGLHLKALRGVPGWDASMTGERILELHGTLFVRPPSHYHRHLVSSISLLQKVHCKHGHQMDRDEFQVPDHYGRGACSRANFSAGHAIYRQSAVEGYDRRMGTHGTKASNES
jgi:hypothetical protein